MKGTRPLDNDEIRRVSTCFTGTFQVRNRGLFMLGVSTGGRISELLSLTIGDVYQNRRAVTDMLFDKSIVKGGEVSRAVTLGIGTQGMPLKSRFEKLRKARASRDTLCIKQAEMEYYQALQHLYTAVQDAVAEQSISN